MLDKIQNGQSEVIGQSQSLDRILGIGSNNPYENNDDKFFIDEYQISQEAIQKYQKELDVKKFSEALAQTDERFSNSLVVQKAFEGLINFDTDDIISEIAKNKDFLNDIK